MDKFALSAVEVGCKEHAVRLGLTDFSFRLRRRLGLASCWSWGQGGKEQREPLLPSQTRTRAVATEGTLLGVASSSFPTSTRHQSSHIFSFSFCSIFFPLFFPLPFSSTTCEQVLTSPVMLRIHPPWTPLIYPHLLPNYRMYLVGSCIAQPANKLAESRAPPILRESLLDETRDCHPRNPIQPDGRRAVHVFLPN